MRILRIHLIQPISFVFILSLILTGCASEEMSPPIGLPTNIWIGPTVDLLKVKTSHDVVKTLLDKQGVAHVFMAISSTREVYHVTVSPDGNLHRELIETNTTPSNISAAFDSSEKLHLLLDDREFVYTESHWQINHDTPWETSGIKVKTPRLIQEKNGLIRTFLVNGMEIGAPKRWSLFGLGGYGGGIIFPWHSDSLKLAIVPEPRVGNSVWYVLDPQNNLDTDNAMFATDDNRNLHVIYASSTVLIDKVEEPRYVRIDLTHSLPQSKINQHSQKRQISLHPVSGSVIPMQISKRRPFSQIAFSADPESGKLLIVRAHDAGISRTRDTWSPPQQLPIRNFFWEPRLAPAGDDAFHLLTVTETGMAYLLYSHERWSTTINLGKPDVASIFGNIWNALDIASNGQNRAFAAWPTKEGIVGRWVEGNNLRH